jgi:alpha-beta hydrolase superfamily lysophospholipase
VSSPAALIVLTSTLLALAAIAGFLGFAVWKYTPIIGRIFEEKPLFLPLRVPPVQGGDDVRFQTADGLDLVGTYLKARTPRRSGVIVYCHEYLSDRWSAILYADHLRNQGFDLFSFDFRNHGESDVDPSYSPLQWVTDREVTDLTAALAYLRTRHDADPAGVGLFGVSRGGGTALSVAGGDPRVWGVITDGAFPTRGTMLPYILRWAELYVGSRYLWKWVPVVVFDFLGWAALLRTGAKLGCRYASVERGVSRLAPRPWLSIHGGRDNYIGVDIAKKLFKRAGEPKELWVVEGAKHNRCREKDPVGYPERISSFLQHYSPRASQEVEDEGLEMGLPATALLEMPVHANLAVPVSG